MPVLRQASADHEKKLLHADADPLRALGPAFETHPAELEGDAAVERDDDPVGAGVRDAGHERAQGRRGRREDPRVVQRLAVEATALGQRVDR